MNALDELRRNPLDDTLPTPLYQQLKQRLLQLIAAGVLTEDKPLPTEQQLCDALGLSRATVRRCFQDLVAEKRVTRHRGKGTFPVIGADTGLDLMLGFTDEMRGAGKAPSSRLIHVRKVKGASGICASLKIHMGASLWETKRLRLADGRPLRIETSWIPCSLCPSLTRDDVEKSLYAHLAEKAGIIPNRADDIFEAVTLDAREASLLEVPAGAAALRGIRVAFDTLDRPFEMSVVYYRGDAYRLAISMDPTGITYRRVC